MRRERWASRLARGSFAGDGMIERLRTTTFALLGLTAAVGLVGIILFASAGYSVLPPGPPPTGPVQKLGQAQSLGSDTPTTALGGGSAAQQTPAALSPTIPSLATLTTSFTTVPVAVETDPSVGGGSPGGAHPNGADPIKVGFATLPQGSSEAVPDSSAPGHHSGPGGSTQGGQGGNGSPAETTPGTTPEGSGTESGTSGGSGSEQPGSSSGPGGKSSAGGGFPGEEEVPAEEPPVEAPPVEEPPVEQPPAEEPPVEEEEIPVEEEAPEEEAPEAEVPATEPEPAPEVPAEPEPAPEPEAPPAEEAP